MGKESNLDHLDLREEIVEVSRRMSVSRLVVGTSGNVSARTPDGNVLMTPSGLDYPLMGPEDVVLVDLGGKGIEGSFEPSDETPMYTGIYRSRPETGGTVHTHARYSTTLACLNWEITPIHYMLAVLSDEGRVPIARYATYGTEELARNASEALRGPAPGVPAQKLRHHRHRGVRGRGLRPYGASGGDGRGLLPRKAGRRSRDPDP
jgi:L-fuculose-phosphate aldolase